MKHETKMHYANDSWSSGVCGSMPLSNKYLTWRFEAVTCKACLKNKLYKQDLAQQPKLDEE